MIPQINGGITEQITFVTQPSKTYKDHTDKIIGYVDGIEALKQAIFYILSTERYAYAIYDNNYGVELEKYIGNSFNYLEATIENTLKEALLQDDRIIDLKVKSVNKESIDSASVVFDVYTNIGVLEVVKTVNV